MNRSSPDDMKAMQVMEYVEELEKKYKKLKEENKELKAYKSWYILLKERIDGRTETQNKLAKENKELKKKKRDIKQKLIKLEEAQAKLIRVAENKELKEEVKKRKMIADENWTGYDMMKDEYDKLEQENKELKEKLSSFSL